MSLGEFEELSWRLEAQLIKVLEAFLETLRKIVVISK